VLESEVIAQQTSVERVVPRWHAFMDRWPTPTALARSDLSELLRLWSGLGYPRRARNLHVAACRIADELDGEVPSDLDALLALPGIGAYTARAVLAFADEAPVGVVDTNIARVLARRAGRRLGAVEAQQMADAAVPRSDPWLWNQSIMEIGATFCRPAPRCDGCPLHPSCAWALDGRPQPDPAVRSAGVSRPQPPFRGSDREARGRLLAAVLDGPVAPDAVAAAAGLVGDADRARRLAGQLLDEGLVAATPGGELVAP
jgi:A/G-specific adenine glycosylase